MKTLQQIHHDDQMEAYRRDFAVYWEKTKAKLYSGWTPKTLALLELKYWRAWLEARRPPP